MEFRKLIELYLPSAVLRQIDQDAVRILGIPSVLLMENAARGVCQTVQDRYASGQIVVVCGRGNNGGDGLAITRLLAAEGIPCQCFLVQDSKPLTSDAAANYDFLKALQIPVLPAPSTQLTQLLSGLSKSDCIIDALLGTGIRGDVRSPYSGLIDAINQSEASVLSVDVPSGLNSDDGTTSGPCIRADHTVTFVCQKTGFKNPAAKDYTGTIEVRPIGLPVDWVVGGFGGRR